MNRLKWIVLLTGVIFLSLLSTSYSGYTLKEGIDETKRWETFYNTIGSDNDWKQVKDKNGIKVYTRKTDASPIKSFRGIIEIKADFQEVVAFLADGETFPSYVYLCKEATILKRNGLADFYMHSINDPPGIRKRDTVSHSKWRQDPDTYAAIMDCVSVPDLIPEMKKSVRVPLVLIRFKVTPKPDGMVEILFEGVGEVGGWIPDWVANLCVTMTPVHTLRNIMEKRPFETYKGKPVDFLKKMPPWLESEKTAQVN